jgi:hypothetical protein
MDWDLRPGDFIKRTELHMRYGGGGQGGIAASRRSPNVLIFTDHAVGKEHGYFDHWDGELFHYCGEGQRGDQTIARGIEQSYITAKTKGHCVFSRASEELCATWVSSKLILQSRTI